jgi:energy-coupling factor transporter ATP-binding protein EcfA2
MSLRQARFDDHWRHIFSRQYHSRFTQVSASTVSCLGIPNVEFSAGLSAIVGANGVGKSTIAAAIAELLSNSSPLVAEGYRTRLMGSTLNGLAVVGGAELHLRVQDDAAGKRDCTGERFTGDFRWLEPSTLASRCLNQILSDQNFNDLLESVSPLELDAEELGIVSYLVGKNYTKFEIYEIADYARVDRFPYLRATSAGVTYGSEGMGRGELSLLLTYWTLRDLPKNSILILEEPETHVSPRSQDCLMNIVAKFCDQTGLWVLITTHSPTVIRRIPQEHVKLIVRGNGPSAVVKDATNAEIALILGGGVAFRGALLVEDDGAKGFVMGILEESAPELLPQFEIVIADSESGITRALKAMPQTQTWLSLIGAYDGDMRGKIDGKDFRWPFMFLPGKIGPDEVLKQMVESTSDISELLAAELHKQDDHVSLAVNLAAGVDHHDYIRTLGTALGLDAAIVRRSLVRIWLAGSSNADEAEKFINDLRSEIDRRPRETS